MKTEAPHTNVFLVGTGVVGSALLAILQDGGAQRCVQLTGVANTRGLALSSEHDHAVSHAEARAIALSPRSADGSVAIDDHVLDVLATRAGPVLVDATAADGMEDLYGRALSRGIHVVSANKKPFSSAWPKRAKLFDTALRARGAKLRYEATVGAGLPVIETLKDLVRTGDRVRLIECVLSGTLGFLANELQAGTPLSRAVAVARDRGFTEPDPREDLGGTDVARKAVVLARELGAPLEMADVELEPFVPGSVLEASSAEHIARDLARLDDELAAKVARAKARGEKLVYLARIESEASAGGERVRAAAGPVLVPIDHPAATLGGSSALVAFTTARYDKEPLVVRGSGAGGAVTASALLADVLKATGHAS